MLKKRHLKIKSKKVAVIGGGIAGVMSARLLGLLGYEVTLFEKANRLGGCAGSFIVDNIPFNIAATTIGGLFPSYPVDKAFKILSFCPQEKFSLSIHVPTFLILMEDRKFFLTPYFEDLKEIISEFLGSSSLAKRFLKDTEKVLNSLKVEPYFHVNGFINAIRSFFYLIPLALNNFSLYFQPAEKYLRLFLNTRLNVSFKRFLNALTLITAQSSLERVSAYTLHLALGYPLSGVGMVEEGNEVLFSAMAKDFDYFLNCEVKGLKVLSSKEGFKVETELGEERFQSVVLALPVLENLGFLKDEDLKNFFSQYVYLRSPYSALIAYGTITDFVPLCPHYLLITDYNLENLTTGNYLISFLKLNHLQRAVSFTLSTHLDLTTWKNLEKKLEYSEIKTWLEERVIRLLKNYLSIPTSNFKLYGMATPKTFKKYIGRETLGGIPITLNNSFWKIPPNLTSFKRLYFISDQSLFYQGWIGISLGLLNLYQVWKNGI